MPRVLSAPPHAAGSQPLERLAILLARNELREQARAQRRRWDAHNELVRGNPVRVYEGKEFIPH